MANPGIGVPDPHPEDELFKDVDTCSRSQNELSAHLKLPKLTYWRSV